MTSTPLAKALTAIASSVRQVTPTQLQQAALNASAAPFGVLMADGSRTASLVAALRANGALDKLEGRKAFGIANAGELTSETLANATLERLALGDDTDSISSDIYELARTGRAKCAFVYALQGFAAPTSRHTLQPGVYIDRPENLHRCASREMLFRIDAFGQLIRDFRTPFYPRPEAGLVIEETRAVFDNVKSDLGEYEIHMQRALTSLTLAGPCTPFAVGSTSWIGHPVLGYHAFGGAMSAYDAIQHAPTQPYDADLATKLFEQFGKLNQKEQTAINLSTQWLSRARRANDVANIAIALRIAMESLFMHGNDSGNSEIAQKLATRGAELLENTPQKKLEMFRFLKKAYGTTSAAVHNGTLDFKHKTDLDKLSQTMGRAARSIIQRGGFPNNWDDFVYLG